MDYVSASNQYYAEIASGVYTRASQFKQHVPLKDVKSAIFKSLVPRGYSSKGVQIRSEVESMKYLRNNYPTSYNFIKSLEANDNELQDYASKP